MRFSADWLSTWPMKKETSNGRTLNVLKIMSIGIHPSCDGIDLAYLRKYGFARLTVGARDNRERHKEGRFPTPSGKCEFKLNGARNFVAGSFRQMYEGSQVWCGFLYSRAIRFRV